MAIIGKIHNPEIVKVGTRDWFESNLAAWFLHLYGLYNLKVLEVKYICE